MWFVQEEFKNYQKGTITACIINDKEIVLKGPSDLEAHLQGTYIEYTIEIGLKVKTSSQVDKHLPTNAQQQHADFLQSGILKIM